MTAAPIAISLTHHGCPDSQVPTADCPECELVLGVEAEGESGIFTGTDLMPVGQE